MKKVLVLALLLVAAPAMADYYVAGSFQSPATWQPAADVMTQVSPGHYQLTVTGNDRHEFKVTDGTWDNTWPADNARADFGNPGSLTVNFFEGAQADGWLPAENRVGYVDNELHGWDIMGSFNDWSGPVAMTGLGDGVYVGETTVALAGNYVFKFRKYDDWDISIGEGFRNYGGDIALETTSDNEFVRFELDLPNGRYRVVPEPATLAMLAFGAVALLRRR